MRTTFLIALLLLVSSCSRTAEKAVPESSETTTIPAASPVTATAPAPPTATTGTPLTELMAGNRTPSLAPEGATGDAPYLAPISGTEMRVTFPKDFSSVTLRGNVARDKPMAYLVTGGKGMTMRVEITESNPNNDVVFSVTSPAGLSLVGPEGESYDTKWSDTLPEDGEYRIEVGLIESEASPFKIDIAVE